MAVESLVMVVQAVACLAVVAVAVVGVVVAVAPVVSPVGRVAGPKAPATMEGEVIAGEGEAAAAHRDMVGSLAVIRGARLEQ